MRCVQLLRAVLFVIAAVTPIVTTPAKAELPNCPGFSGLSDLLELTSETFTPGITPDRADLDSLSRLSQSIESAQLKTQLARLRIENNGHYMNFVGLVADIHSVADRFLTRGEAPARSYFQSREIERRLSDTTALLAKLCGASAGAEDGAGKMTVFLQGGLFSSLRDAVPTEDTLTRIGSVLVGLGLAIGAILILRYLYQLIWALVLVRRSCAVPVSLTLDGPVLYGKIYMLGARGCAIRFDGASTPYFQATPVHLCAHLQTEAGAPFAKLTFKDNKAGNVGGFRFFETLAPSELSDLLALSEEPVRLKVNRRR